MLIPRFGIIGAAWANAAAYGSRPRSPTGCRSASIPSTYESGRLLRVWRGGLAVVSRGRALPADAAASVGILLRGSTVVLVMGALLASPGSSAETKCGR